MILTFFGHHYLTRKGKTFSKEENLKKTGELRSIESKVRVIPSVIVTFNHFRDKE